AAAVATGTQLADCDDTGVELRASAGSARGDEIPEHLEDGLCVDRDGGGSSWVAVCDPMGGHRSRRADRAPGRGRGGEGSAWRRDLTGHRLDRCYFLSGVASQTLTSMSLAATILWPSGLKATPRIMSLPRPSVMISSPVFASHSLTDSSAPPPVIRRL